MTFDYLEELACGEMGLQIDYFYSLTPRQFDNHIIGHFKKRQSDLRNKMTLNRELMFTTLQPHMKKNNNLTPEKIWPFSWEKKHKAIDLEAEIQAVESQKEFWENYDKTKNLA